MADPVKAIDELLEAMQAASEQAIDEALEPGAVRAAAEQAAERAIDETLDPAAFRTAAVQAAEKAAQALEAVPQRPMPRQVQGAAPSAAGAIA
eukprot:9467882-Alexandrium_andersonii.AAC.1